MRFFLLRFGTDKCVGIDLFEIIEKLYFVSNKLRYLTLVICRCACNNLVDATTEHFKVIIVFCAQPALDKLPKPFNQVEVRLYGGM